LANFSLGSYGLIEFSLVYNEGEEHLVVNVIKAKVSRVYINFLMNEKNWSHDENEILLMSFSIYCPVFCMNEYW